MKKTILCVKGNNKDEFWSSLNGNALEVMAANLTALQNTIECLKKSEERGEQFIQMLFEDIQDLFAENGVNVNKKKGKRTKENG